MLNNKLYAIAKDLGKYEGLTGEAFFTLCVNKKLTKQISSYLTELNRESAWSNTLSWGKDKVWLFKQLIKIQEREYAKADKAESENKDE